MNLELKINVQTEVNENQYNWVRNYCKGLLAHRKDKEGKLFIMPFIFMGHKKQIENNLNKLN